MGVTVVAILNTLFASFVAWFIAPDGALQKTRIAIVWAAATVVAFIVPIEWAVLIVLAGLLAVASGAKPLVRTAVFVGSLNALPAHLSYKIPFPGLNYLIEVDFARVAALVVLMPAFVMLLSAPGHRKLRFSDAMLATMPPLIGAMALRDLPFTSALREIVSLFLLVYLPYFCITRSARSIADIDLLLKAMFVGLCVVCFIGAASFVEQWNYFANIGDIARSKVFSDRRFGSIRLYTTMTPFLTGYLAACGAAAALHFRRTGAIRALYAYPLAAAFSGVVLFTGSRAALIVLVLIVLTSWTFARSKRGQRRLLVASAMVAAAGVTALIVTGGLNLRDAYGTFDYRAELLRVGFDQIARRPLFGTTDVTDLPAFQELVQGEGIVDLVNQYLQIALSYGLVGMALYFGPFLVAGRRLLEAMDSADAVPGGDPARKQLAALLFSFLAGYLALSALTSATSYLAHFGFVVMALCLAGGIAIAEAPSAAPAPASATEPVVARARAAAPPGRGAPYGARYFRRGGSDGRAS